MNGLNMRGLLPAEFVTHRRAAKRERLLSLRCLLDAAIEWLDEGEAGVDQAGARQRKPAWPLPREFWSHHRAAHREDLLALRSLIEAGIGRLEKPARAEQATRIDIT